MFKPRRVKALSKALTGLFVNRTNNNVTLLNHKAEYYKLYFPPVICVTASKWWRRWNASAKKAAAEKLMKAGFKRWMGAKVSEHIQAERIAREH